MQDKATVTLINRIANVHPPIPALIIDDSSISYCNATKMPEKCDTAADGKPIAYCPHLIELKLGQVYEFLLVDDDRTYTFLRIFEEVKIELKFIFIFITSNESSNAYTWTFLPSH